MNARHGESNLSTFSNPNYALLSIILVVILTSAQKWWQTRINDIVTEPYLDEFFHARQAQLYCSGNFSYWDPKITTPPGLYVTSYALHVLGRPCTLSSLRQTNNEFLTLGILVPLLLLFNTRHQAKGNAGVQWLNLRVDREVVKALHSAVNICLFPPLFFFASLYYTDVASTACVLWFLHLREHDVLKPRPLIRSLILLSVGLVALCFRQTNIFWVAIFPGALDVVESLKTWSSRSTPASGSDTDIPLTYADVLGRSWNDGVVYDLPYNAAYVEDFVKSSISIAIVAIKSPFVIFQALVPYIVLLAAFGAFVLMNGGVVLGDKANHVATIHVPQMLYIWPYIFFFSWQLIIPRVRALISPAHLLPDVFKRFRPQNPVRALPRPLPVISFLAFALAAVHHNTIVHPFTLADNRHYVFYVFRILLRHPILKYLATPAYIFCGWAALLALGLPPQDSSTNARLKTEPLSANMSKGQQTVPDPDTTMRGCSTSYVLIWLLSTTLCLITAPLVEPRYVIIPWITWRLGVAYLPSENTARPENKVTSLELTRTQAGLQLLGHGEHRLYVETAWFVLVNVVTAYMFLYRGFEWAQEPGAVQRFMW